MATIDTIFFDLGGVCLTDSWGTASRQQAALAFSLDFDEMEQRHQPCFQSWERDEISLDTYLSQVIFHTDRAFTRQQFVDFMKAQSQPISPSLQLVRELKQTGRYRLATINNENLALNHYRIAHFALRDFFSAFFSSCYLGIRKPQEQVYDMALHIMAVPPDKAVFIDDRQENIHAAALRGMHAIHFQSAERLHQQLRALHIL